jgi:hypothetical protein
VHGPGNRKQIDDDAPEDTTSPARVIGGIFFGAILGLIGWALAVGILVIVGHAAEGVFR